MATATPGPVVVGAVLYDPKVSVIWDIIRDFFEARGCPMDVVLYADYERQVTALLDQKIDVAWNSPLAWVDAQRRSQGRCRAIAIRIAHGDGAAAVARSPLRVDPGQRRVPGDVDRAGQQSIVLILIGGVERDVDRRPLRVEEVADDLPDDRDLGVVHHGPDFQRTGHQKTSIPHSARPMNSYA